MRPAQCVGELYLTVADSLAPLPTNNKKKNFFWQFPIAGEQKRSSQIFLIVSGFSNKISTVQKIVLSSCRGTINFQGLKLRGQDHGPDLRSQGQGLQKCVLEDKDVLEDYTSALWGVDVKVSFE